MYKLSPLLYKYNSLEPYIDSQTIDIHYNKHYKGYLDRLNNILNDLGYDYSYSMEDLVNHIDIFPIEKRGDILYNLGGVLNHSLYFNNMSPNYNTKPVGKLNDKIVDQYGSFDSFKNEFIKKANSLIGSGYTFLVIKKDGNLDIVNMSNQETPYTYDMIPIMTIDLWEHAYYLKYKNNRSKYIDNFFNIVDFKVINDNYEKNL